MWEQVSIKNQDKIAQAGLALSEQALMFSDVMNVPDNMSGKIKVLSVNDWVEIDSPLHEYIQNKAQRDEEGSGLQAKVFGENKAKIADEKTNTVLTMDEQLAGFALDNAITHRTDARTVIRDGAGNMIYQLDGKATPLKSSLDSSFGVFAENNFGITNAKGEKLPLQMHVFAQNGGNNVLSIRAELLKADATGSAVLDANGKPQVIKSVDMQISEDPGLSSASFTLTKK